MVLAANGTGCTEAFTSIWGAGRAVGFDGIEYDEVKVTLVDGDTGKPIAHGSVYTPHGQWGAKSDSAKTDASGRATLTVARNIGGGIEAHPDGYMTSVNYREGEAGTGDVMVLAFRPPRPVAGLTIPAGYEGLLRVRPWQYGDPSPEPPALGSPWMNGKREFYTPAQVDGVTSLAPPPKLTQNQPYNPQVRIARFDDGTPLRFENAISRSGWSGENIYALTQNRDRVPPGGDEVALYHLGLQTEFSPTTRPGLRYDGQTHSIFFVGKADAAAAEQRRLVGDATVIPDGQVTSSGYAFRPNPLNLDEVE